MKLVAMFGIAAHSLNPSIVQCRVPINPILGETLQRELETGERFYAEQISHHPPISAYTMTGPNDEFEYSGFHTLKAWFNGTQSMGGSKEGKSFLKLKDGTVYKFQQSPQMSIENLLLSSKRQVFYDKSVIIDKKNNIECEIHYNPNFNTGASGTAYRYTVGWLPGMNGLGLNEKAGRESRGDDFHIFIYEVNGEEKKLVSEGQGSWLSYIEIDGQVKWKIDDPVPQWRSHEEKLTSGDLMMPSDSQYRTDTPLML